MALREVVTIDDTIEFLNHLLQVDPTALYALVESRVHCNEALALHPTVQVCDYGSESGPKVGLLGLLNGIFGTESDGGGPIAAVFGVVCPNCGKQDGRVDDLCPKGCGNKLEFGDLEKFTRRLV